MILAAEFPYQLSYRNPTSVYSVGIKIVQSTDKNDDHSTRDQSFISI